MKQTAVEWLVKYLSERSYIQAPSFGHPIIDKAIEQAKEIYTQQIIDAWVDGNDNEPKEVTEDFAEQYYKETYNN
jgi:hypothetical protein